MKNYLFKLFKSNNFNHSKTLKVKTSNLKLIKLIKIALKKKTNQFRNLWIASTLGFPTNISFICEVSRLDYDLNNRTTFGLFFLQHNSVLAVARVNIKLQTIAGVLLVSTVVRGFVFSERESVFESWTAEGICERILF